MVTQHHDDQVAREFRGVCRNLAHRDVARAGQGADRDLPEGFAHVEDDGRGAVGEVFLKLRAGVSCWITVFPGTGQKVNVEGVRALMEAGMSVSSSEVSRKPP